MDKLANVQGYGSVCPQSYEYAMAGILPRYAGWLHYVAGGEGDVMAEARCLKADRGLSDAYRDIYFHGTTSYPGPKPISGANIRRTVTTRNLKLKLKRANIAGLQLADLLTYCCKVDILTASIGQLPTLGLSLRRFSLQFSLGTIEITSEVASWKATAEYS